MTLLTKPENTGNATRYVSIYLGSLFLAYCLVFLWVCPSVKLGCAVSFEVGFFALSVFLISKKVTLMPAGISRFLVRVEEFRPVRYMLNLIRRVRLAVIVVVAAFVTVDFVAFCSAALGCAPVAVALYGACPTSQLIGLRPAATLESLAGAFVERREFDSADRLYREILAVRQQVAGPRSDLVAALYADFADLNVRRHDIASAETFYRKAIDIAPDSGRALTGLATSLREQGRFDESEKFYEKALDSRARAFGTSSRLYNDTLRAYEKLKQCRRTAGS